MLGTLLNILGLHFLGGRGVPGQTGEGFCSNMIFLNLWSTHRTAAATFLAFLTPVLSFCVEYEHMAFMGRFLLVFGTS